MSVATEITRLQNLRNALRTKLVALGFAVSTATLEELVETVEGIIGNGNVSETLDTSKTSYTVPAGLHDGTGTVKIVLETKTVTPTKAKQSMKPATGKVYSQVDIEAIPDNYADISGVTTLQADVLANKIFVDTTGAEKAGTMANNGAVTASIDGLTTTEYVISAGYHNGLGKVSLTSDIEEALAAI